jgi:predicted deacylase
VSFQRAGMVICKRHPGRVERGDCVAHLATEFKESGSG